MARTKQTARKSVSGKAPKRSAVFQAYAQKRQTVAKQEGKKELTDAELEAAAPVNVNYDVSYESSFYAHYFIAQITNTNLFLPSFALATTVDPWTKENAKREYWLSINFNSCFDGHGIRAHRSRLHLVITLDISGSMSDRFEGEPGKSKIQVAQQSLLTLLRQLSPDDALGIVLFNQSATVLQSIEQISSIDMKLLEEKILKLRAGGGTNISEAIECASNLYDTSLYKNGMKDDNHLISRRIFFLTDMEVSKEDGNKFLKRIDSNAHTRTIWSTVVGVGLDLGDDVIQSVSRTIGCNYCNVRSAATFDQLMNTEFHYTVTPIAFNIDVTIDGDRYRFEQGYGSPEIHQVVDQIEKRSSIHLVTEFPSPMNEKNEVRGGCFLFRIIDHDENNPDRKIQMKTSWDTIEGIRQNNIQDFQFSNDIETFTNSGIRKAIVLTRYTTFLKRYLKLRQASATSDIIDEYQTMRRQYPKLVEYFHREMKLIDDSTLEEEEYKHLIDIATQDDIPLNSNLQEDIVEPPTTSTKETSSSTLPSLESISRRDLQSLAKRHSIKGNLKNDALVRKLSDLMENTKSEACCICLTNPSSVLILPCHHKCLCDECAKKQGEDFDKCPICRQDIFQTTKTNEKRQRTEKT